MADNYNDVQVNLVINKMPLSTYTELETQKKLQPYELYFINDVTEFDVKNMRIVNVEDPTNERDAVNVSYAKNNLVYKNNLESNLKDFNHYNTKIMSPDAEYCLSSDGGLYQKKHGIADWAVEVVAGPYTSDQITIGYQESGSGAGWLIIRPGGTIQTSIIDKNLQRFEYTNNDGSESYIVRRDVWSKTDEFIKKSELKAQLSALTYESTVAEVVAAL